MTKKQKPVRLDLNKCNKSLDKLQSVLNESKLSLEELAWVYGQLGYDIGASLEGEAYDIETLTKKYYEGPEIAVAFMLQGLTIQTWMTKESKNDNKTNE